MLAWPHAQPSSLRNQLQRAPIQVGNIAVQPGARAVPGCAPCSRPRAQGTCDMRHAPRAEAHRWLRAAPCRRLPGPAGSHACAASRRLPGPAGSHACAASRRLPLPALPVVVHRLGCWHLLHQAHAASRCSRQGREGTVCRASRRFGVMIAAVGVFVRLLSHQGLEAGSARRWHSLGKDHKRAVCRLCHVCRNSESRFYV